jgi:5-methylcytosine-specific restriction endonuclease McrA
MSGAAFNPDERPRSRGGLCADCGLLFAHTPARGAVPKRCAECSRKRRNESHRGYDKKRGWKRENDTSKSRKKRWRSRNVEADRKRCLEYYHSNAGRCMANARAWKADNKTRCAENFSVWRRANADRIKLTKYRRACAVRKSPGVSLRDWRLRVEEFGGRCAYCLAPATDIEHMIPLARGGLHELSNVVPACRQCNASKGARTPLLWLLSRVVRP